MKAIMEHCGHPKVGVTWNSNATDLKDGSVAESFKLLRPWIFSCHINDLYKEHTGAYPYRELFRLLRQTGYDRYTLCEVGKTPPTVAAGEEFLRWDDPDLVYDLAGSARPEPRALGGELLLGVLVEGDGVRRVPAAWLDGPRLFRLAESPHKAAREAALTLIRRLYDQVGGAERLAWLMDSTERDVRLFAVRLFWDRHRPKPWPTDYKPRKNVGAAIGTERFADLPALRQFARVVLFGLPPCAMKPVSTRGKNKPS